MGLVISTTPDKMSESNPEPEQPPKTDEQIEEEKEKNIFEILREHGEEDVSDLEDKPETEPYNELERYIYITMFENKSGVYGCYMLLSPEELTKWANKSVNKLRAFVKQHGRFINRAKNVRMADFGHYLLSYSMIDMQNSLLENIKTYVGKEQFDKLPLEMKREFANPGGLHVVTDIPAIPTSTKSEHTEFLLGLIDSTKPIWNPPMTKLDKNLTSVMKKMCQEALTNFKRK